MSRINFEETPQYKKGKIGEDIVKAMLIEKGWVPYSPEPGRPHYFDILATKDKKSVIAIDVKTKARLNKWYAQGINISHYNQYINFVNITNVPFYLVFVDDKIGDIHLANITKLKNPIYPSLGIIAWPLDQMQKIGNIGGENIEKLSTYDQRSWNCDFLWMNATF